MFVIYYLGRAKANGAAAARLAGYADPARDAYDLMIKREIREAIDAKIDQIGMTEEEVLIRISERAESGMEHFVTFNPDGSPHSLPSLDLRKARRKGQLGNIKKIKTTRTPGDNPMEITEVEVHDSLPALALLAKIHGLTERKANGGDSETETIREFFGLDGSISPGEDAPGG